MRREKEEKMKKYFDTYKEAREFMEEIGEERILNYGKVTIMDKLKNYVEYNPVPARNAGRK